MLLAGPDITIIAFTATIQPGATKTPVLPKVTEAKEPAEKPKDAEPHPQPIDPPK